MKKEGANNFTFPGYPSDKTLVNALISSKNTIRNPAFNSLLDTLHQPIYYHLRRLLGNHEDAADATQNTFIKVHTSLNTFRFESKLSSWIFSIATRQGIDLIRKRKEEVTFEDHLACLESDVFFDGDEASTRLQAAVLSLPDKQRAVFVLKYFEGHDYKSISECTGTSIGALKASFHHAKEKIKPLLISNVI
jgi:RNA polymerase sigma-70 factor (ECF subfamily)